MSLFSDEKKRKINLGGSSSGASPSQLRNQVRQQRELRQQQKLQAEAATKIQSRWRRTQAVEHLRIDLRQGFESDVTGINGMRCLVLLGYDEDALGRWCIIMLQQDWSSSMTDSWLVLARQLSARLVISAANNKPNALLYLQVLDRLVQHPTSGPHVLRYLLARNYYTHLAKCLLATPKMAPVYPPLIPLITTPFRTFPQSSPEYRASLCSLFSNILVIDVLPNRLPLKALTEFTSKLPLARMDLLEPFTLSSIECNINLLANLLTFAPPFYPALKTALPAYLKLLTAVLNSLPVGAFEPPSQGKVPQPQTWGQDSDDEDITVRVVDEFTQPVRLPEIDPRTFKRLQSLPTPAHLSKLATHAKNSLELVRFLLAVATVWPSQRANVLSVVTQGWMRELYRGYIRGSNLGKDSSTVFSPSNADGWPVILLLADAYAQMLLTMGDDEFFGTGDAAKTRTANPLSLDELTSWTRQLLNISFALYWRDREGALRPVSVGLRVSWDSARDVVTRCLVAIHERDSRRPFVRPDHWHILTDAEDVQGFVEAAKYEEENVDLEEDLKAGRSRKQLVELSPRLGILNNIPFAIPFDVRVSMFRAFVMSDRQRTGHSHPLMFPRDRSLIRIRREHIAQDGFDRLETIDLKTNFQIEFEDQWGQVEAGIDGGGVFKEFFTCLCKEVFDTDRGLWLTNRQQELYPSPSTYAKESHSLSWYRFIGRILGKAMYDGILVDVAFAPFFLSKLLGRQSLLDDLASLDEELWRNLMFLKHFDGDFDALSLTFTVSQDEFGVTRNVDLVPNGSSVAVSRENRLQYILLMAHYKLAKQIKLQSDAFFEGMKEIVQPRWLKMFNQQEVQILIGGVDSLVDFGDLRANTNYGGLYDDDSPHIKLFWSVVETFDQAERRALLRFATSCSRPPLLGFRELVPHFCIRDAGQDEMRLPTSSTCVNLLKLPMYKNPRIMKDKLLKAIMAGAGFDLS